MVSDLTQDSVSGRMSPEQELQFIRQVITDSRQSMVEDGKPYIVWGALVAAAMLVTYIVALNRLTFDTGWLWIGMVVLGLGYTLLETRRSAERARIRVRTFADRLAGAIWGACGTALGLTIVLIMVGYSDTEVSIPPIFTCSLAAIILGIAYFLSGIVNDIKWLKYIGYAWWLGSIVLYFMRSVHVLGVYALLLIVLQVIPGIALNRMYRRSQNEQAARITTIS